MAVHLSNNEQILLFVTVPEALNFRVEANYNIVHSKENEQEECFVHVHIHVHVHQYLPVLKAVDTIGSCQRIAFIVGVSQQLYIK